MCASPRQAAAARTHKRGQRAGNKHTSVHTHKSYVFTRHLRPASYNITGTYSSYADFNVLEHAQVRELYNKLASDHLELGAPMPIDIRPARKARFLRSLRVS